MTKLRVILFISLLAVSAIASGARATPPKPRAKLVVGIVVDGLRWDTLHRTLPQFGEGGFRLLLDRGVEYRQADYKHSNTFTAVGHATLYSGTYPPHHGVIGNYWFDPQSGERVYAVGDDTHPIIGQPAEAGRGRSPSHMLSTTVGDELVLATNGRSRVFGVSGKDRAAILPAGHLGQAYWYDRGTGHFVTSTYYCEQYPAWAAAWNEGNPAERYRDTTWTLSHDAKDYLNKVDDRPGEKGYRYLDRAFPHELAGDDAADLADVLRYTPYVDELMLEFVKRLVAEEKVGQGDNVDLLALSFSAMDYIQHAWGVRSMEAEDNLLRVDRTLADLFRFLDETVGLDNTLIFLTADHGFDDIPEEWQRLGFQAGRLDPKEIVASANAALSKRFDTRKDLVLAYWPPSMYLDLKAIEELGLDAAVVERMAADRLRRLPGVAMAVTRSDLLAGRLADDSNLRRVRMAFHPKRSGNVLLVQDQFWYAYTAPKHDAATHGSPYRYDTHVPLIFAGPGVKHGVVNRPVGPEEIAATIAAYLGIAAPSASANTTLIEVVGEQCSKRAAAR